MGQSMIHCPYHTLSCQVGPLCPLRFFVFPGTVRYAFLAQVYFIVRGLYEIIPETKYFRLSLKEKQLNSK